MEYKRTDIYIDKIINKVVNNGGEEQKVPVYYDTEAHFQIKTPEKTSTIEYDVVIKNDSEEIKWLSKVETLLNTNDPNIVYEITGFKVGDAIKPGEAKTSHIKIHIKEDVASLENPITLLNVLFQFERLDWKSLQAEFVSETDYGDLSTSTSGVTFQIKVTNPNPVSVNYNITSNNARFTITDATTGKSGYQIEAKASATHSILITLRPDVNYTNLEEQLLLLLRTTYPVSEDINIHTVTLKLPNNLKNTILKSKEIQAEPDNYTGVEATNGYLMRTTEIDELSYTYYYRGVIENNYVSFAGNLWRIVRVDSNGNVRVVLNDNVSTEKYNSNYSSNSVENIDAAIKLIDYKNSNVRNAVETWYNANVASNADSKFVVNSKFCIDTSFQAPIDTIDEHTVYYFTPYLHVGRDSNKFKPDFTCASENVFTSSVGLLTAEEILAAGGYWEKFNKNYYLYNKDLADDVAQTSWTMSGSYYSISEKQAGVIVFNQMAKGSLFDWVQGGNLTQNYGYRPVISLNGNAKVVGNGTKENPYILMD